MWSVIINVLQQQHTHDQSDGDYSENSDISSSSRSSWKSEDVEESSITGDDSSSYDAEETLNESVTNQESELETDTTVVEEQDHSESLIVSFPLAQLGSNDLYAVQTHLWDARDRWYFIGQALRISQPTLSVIEQNHPHDVDRCFMDMLQEWLRNGKPPRTYGVLIEALKAKTVGMEHLVPELLQYVCYVNIQ